MNRKNENEFEEISEWLRSEPPPFTDEDRAAMRRAVWREIETHRRPERGLRPARLVLAGGALLAAVLVVILWLAPPVIAPVAPVLAAATTHPVTGAEAVQHPPAEESPGPSATGASRPRVRPRRTDPRAVPVRIEFQTANPEVRIIWLVKKGEAAPRPFSASRHQEVS